MLPGAQRRDLRLGGEAEAGRVKPAQRLVERSQLAVFGVVGQQSLHIVLILEDIVGEAAQRPLWSDLDKHAHAGIVKRMQPLHPLHRRGHLRLQQVLDRFDVGGV